MPRQVVEGDNILEHAHRLVEGTEPRKKEQQMRGITNNLASSPKSFNLSHGGLYLS